MIDGRKMDKMLRDLGHPRNLLGTQYMPIAVALYEREQGHMTEVYRGLAAAFDTTPQRAERALRHSIEVAWSRSDWETQWEYFGNTVDPQSGKPRNGEYLAMALARCSHED